MARVLDNFYIPTRYPNGYPEGAPFEHYGRLQSGEAIKYARSIIELGYFGSYARGDWGVGSDLDLIVIVESSSEPMERRATEWDTTDLPVPADLLVYTEDEWQKMRSQGRFGRTVMREAVWVYRKMELKRWTDFYNPNA
jgi:predicted nucleotidyltransferase